jgi:hypothetical protein
VKESPIVKYDLANPVIKVVCGNQVFSDYRKYAATMSPVKRWLFLRKVKAGFRNFNRLFENACRDKEVFIGPFIGEFGNFLSYILPLVTRFYRNGVKVNLLCNEVLRPFLLDEVGSLMVSNEFLLPDFYSNAALAGNKAGLSSEMQETVDRFVETSQSSGNPFIDLSDHNTYWFIYRSWLVHQRMVETIHYDKFYGKQTRENSIVVFPRKKGRESTPNNGEPWDYTALIAQLADLVEKVYVAGHPEFSHSIAGQNNIEVITGKGNDETLRRCSQSKLIICQHSGTVYLGEYTNTQTLVIFKGPMPIKGINDTLVWDTLLGNRTRMDFAFSEEDILSYVKRHFGYEKT